MSESDQRQGRTVVWKTVPLGIWAVEGVVLVLFVVYAVVNWPDLLCEVSHGPSEVIRNIALGLLGGMGLPFVIWRAITAQQQVDEDQRQTEIQSDQYGLALQSEDRARYHSAVELVSDRSMVKQLAGVRSLIELSDAETKWRNNRAASFLSAVASGNKPTPYPNPHPEKYHGEPETTLHPRILQETWKHLFEDHERHDLPIRFRETMEVRRAMAPDRFISWNNHRRGVFFDVQFKAMIIRYLPKIEPSFTSCYFEKVTIFDGGENGMCEGPIFMNCVIEEVAVSSKIPLPHYKEIFDNCVDQHGNPITIETF